MAPVDIDAVRKKREEKQRSNDFFAFEQGDTIIGIVEPCRPEDSVPFLELVVHYGVGGENGMVVCLDLEKNKVLADPRVEAFLAEKGTDISGGCPVCEEIASGRIKKEALVKRLRASSKYLMNCLPVKFRSKASVPWTAHSQAGTVQPLFVGYGVWDGVMDLFSSEGDISDRKRMIHVRVNRVGKGAMDTKYTVQADSDTIRKPVALDGATLAAVETAITEGGPGDLYKMVAGMTKSRDAVLTKLSGVPTSGKGGKGEAEEEGEAAAADRPEGAPNCYGVDCAPADPQCQGCEFKVDCAEKCGVEVPPDLKATTKVAKPAAAKPAAKPPLPKTAAAAKPKPAAAPLPEPEPEEAPEEAPAAEPAADAPIYAADATAGNWYQLEDGAVMSCVGPAPKGGGIFFEDENGDRKRLATDAVVTPVSVPAAEEAPAEEESVAEEEPPAEEAPAEEPAADADADLAELEALLSQKKATPAAKPAAAKPAPKPTPKPAPPKAAAPVRTPVKKPA